MATRKIVLWIRTLRRQSADKIPGDVEAQHQRRPGRPVAPAPSQNTTSTESSELFTSTTASSTAHTSLTKPASTSSRSLCVRGIHLMPNTQPDPDLVRRYETTIHGKLVQQLYDLFPRSRLLIEFYTASETGTDPGSGVPSIIIWHETGNDKQGAALVKYKRNCEWLKAFLSKESVLCHVLPGLPSRTSRLIGSESLHLMQTANCVLRVGSEDAESWGISLKIEEKREQAFGGCVLIEGIGLLGLTTRHGFDGLENESKKKGSSISPTLNPVLPISTAQADSKSSRQTAQHRSASLVGPSSYLSHWEQVNAQVSGSDLQLEPSHIAKDISAKAYFPKQSETGSGPLQEDWDWALLDFQNNVDFLKKLQHADIGNGSRLTKGDYKGIMPTSCPVTLQVAKLDLYHGTLSSSKASFRIQNSLHDVRLITLEDSLPPGSSGTWVDYDGFVCGIIIAARQDLPWAYMIPIGPVLDDIRHALKVESVQVPTSADLQSIASAMINHPPQKAEKIEASANTVSSPSGRSLEVVSTIDHALGVSPPAMQVQTKLPNRSISKRMWGSWRQLRSYRSPKSSHSSSSRVSSWISSMQRSSDLGSEYTKPSTAPSFVMPEELLPAPSTFHHSRLKPTQEETALDDTIRCDLSISYDGRELGRPLAIPIKWNFPSSFAKLEAAAQDRLKSEGKGIVESLYMKSGKCRLIVDNTRKQYSSGNLEDERQWLGTVASMVTSFWSQHPADGFHLEVQWDFSGIEIQREEGETFADTIRLVLHSKMHQNWEGRIYISKRDLDAIMSDARVSELIYQDESLHAYEPTGRYHNPSFNKSDFIKLVQLFGCKLLALFVYVKLPLSSLYILMSKGFKEGDLPLADSDCPNTRLGSEWAYLQHIQGGFLAHVFDENEGMPKHVELGKHSVVPIQIHKDIGEGSFGKVFEVSIDPAHHGFSDDRAERFALKRFFDQGSRTQGEFQNESRVLGVLAKFRHPHITRHLALWTQNEKFYMLFPLAEQNLRSYLEKTSHPLLTKETVLWLLHQFKGLADGVRQIHNLTGIGPGMLDRRSSSAHKRERTGFHHDLKPENILVFVDSHQDPDDRVTGRTLKIADFGTARIGLILSGSGLSSRHQNYVTNNLSHGDAAYGAPDYILEGRTARPYDMWSLGCIFLECMLWIFAKPNSSFEDFAAQRMRIPDSTGNQDIAFWYSGRDSSVSLKPAVVERLKELKIECDHRGVFKDLVSIVARLLTIRPAQRTDAPKLCNELDAILLQATVDLHEDPTFYLQKGCTSERGPVAAPPSTDGEYHGASIDERQVAPHVYDAIVPRPTFSPSNTKLRQSQRIEDPDPFRSATGAHHARMLGVAKDTRSVDSKGVFRVQTRELHPENGRQRSPSISLSIYNGSESPSLDDQETLVGNHRATSPIGWHLPYLHHANDTQLRRPNQQVPQRSQRISRSSSFPG